MRYCEPDGALKLQEQFVVCWADHDPDHGLRADAVASPELSEILCRRAAGSVPLLDRIEFLKEGYRQIG